MSMKQRIEFILQEEKKIKDLEKMRDQALTIEWTEQADMLDEQIKKCKESIKVFKKHALFIQKLNCEYIAKYKDVMTEEQIKNQYNYG